MASDDGVTRGHAAETNPTEGALNLPATPSGIGQQHPLPPPPPPPPPQHQEPQQQLQPQPPQQQEHVHLPPAPSSQSPATSDTVPPPQHPPLLSTTTQTAASASSMPSTPAMHPTSASTPVAAVGIDPAIGAQSQPPPNATVPQPTHALLYASTPDSLPQIQSASAASAGSPQRDQYTPTHSGGGPLAAATAAAAAGAAGISSSASGNGPAPGPAGNSSALSLLPPPPQSRAGAHDVEGWALLPRGAVLQSSEDGATASAREAAAEPPAVLPPIEVGSTFTTSKDLRLAVETSLMINGRGLVCKMGGSRQKKFGCAGCNYLVRAVKATGTGHWKISSIEDADHAGCIGGRMRPSSKALVDVAAVMQADPDGPASALRNQLLQQKPCSETPTPDKALLHLVNETSREHDQFPIQGITVNLRQVSRAKAIADKKNKRQRGEPESGQAAVEAEVGVTAAAAGRGITLGKGKGAPTGKRRKFSATAASAAAAATDIVTAVPNLSAETDDQIVWKVVRGAIELHRLEQALGGDCARAVRVRRKAMEHMRLGSRTGSDVLTGLPFEDMDYSRVFGKNCENVVGFVPLPVGVAGPLLVDGEEVWVPLATTEGGLVASVNRGCAAICGGGGYGGARTQVVDDGITRAPCIAMPDIRLALQLKQWAERTTGADAGFPALAAAFESTTQHGQLVSVKGSLAGRYVYLRFKCTSGDAMGMNMVSKGCEAAVEEIQRRFLQARLITLTGNTCTDKKSSARNWIDGRGKSVVVETVVSARTVALVLKSTVGQMVECNLVKNLVGSALAGSIGGFNSHAANVVAAVFLATGQDPAHTVEGSNCMTLMEEIKSGDAGPGRAGDLRVTVTLPSLPVGTIGGGTGLSAQAACLGLMGVSPLSAVAGGRGAAGQPRSRVQRGGGPSSDAGGNNDNDTRRDLSGGGGEGQSTAIWAAAEAAIAAAVAAEAEEAAETEAAAHAISSLPTWTSPPASIDTSAGGNPSGLSAAEGQSVDGSGASFEAVRGGGAGAGSGPESGMESGTASGGASTTPPRPGVVADAGLGMGWGGDAVGGMGAGTNTIADGRADPIRASALQPGAGARRLACMVGAAVLAGELSLLAALTSGDLVSAHMVLNRQQQQSQQRKHPRHRQQPRQPRQQPPHPQPQQEQQAQAQAQAQHQQPLPICEAGQHAGPGVATRTESSQQDGVRSGGDGAGFDWAGAVAPDLPQPEEVQPSAAQPTTVNGQHQEDRATNVQAEVMQPGLAAMHAAVQAAPRMDVREAPGAGAAAAGGKETLAEFGEIPPSSSPSSKTTI